MWEGERARNLARRTMAAMRATVMTAMAQANQQQEGDDSEGAQTMFEATPWLKIAVGDAGPRL